MLEDCPFLFKCWKLYPISVDVHSEYHDANSKQKYNAWLWGRGYACGDSGETDQDAC